MLERTSNRHVKKLFVSLAVAVALVGASCGGDSDDDEGADAPTAEATAEEDGPEETQPSAEQSADDSESASTEGDESEAPSTTTGSPPAAGNVDRDATMRVAFVVPPGSLDPAMARTGISDVTWVFPVYDRLLMVTPDFELEPMLATDWEWSEDELTLTLQLREGVTFHDGTPFNAEAVKANLERTKEVGQAPAQYLESVESVDVLDEYAVQLNLSERDPVLALSLAWMSGAMASPAAFDDLANNPVGTGAYTVVDAQPDRISYERVDGYWDPTADNNARMEIVAIGDDNARLVAMQEGQFDVVNVRANQYDFAQELVESNDLQYFAFPSESVLSLGLNLNVPELADPNVRKALSHAIDRVGMSETITRGECGPTVQPFRPGKVGHVDELVPQADSEYDPELARQLLDEAGIDELNLTAVASSGEPNESFAEVIQAMLNEIGVNLEITVVPSVDAYAAFQGESAQTIITTFSGTGDPASWVANNLSGGNNPAALPADIAEIADSAGVLPLGSAERTAAYESLSEALAATPVHILLCHQPSQWLAASNVTGIDLGAWSRVGGVPDTRFYAKTTG